MARAGRDTGAGDWSIVLGDHASPMGGDIHLGGTIDGYAVFAEVVAGFAVVEAIRLLPTKQAGQTLLVDRVMFDTVRCTHRGVWPLP